MPEGQTLHLYQNIIHYKSNLVADRLDANAKVQGEHILTPPIDFKSKKLVDKVCYGFGIGENVRTYLCHYADDGKAMP